MERDADQAVLDEYLLAIEQLEERRRALEGKLEAVSQEAPYAAPVGWLRCFRGIDTVTALTVVRLGDGARGSPDQVSVRSGRRSR